MDWTACQTGSRVPWVEWACHTVIRLTDVLWAGDGVGLISPALLILVQVVEVSSNSGRQKAVPLLNRNMEQQPERRIPLQPKELTPFVPCSASSWLIDR